VSVEIGEQAPDFTLKDQHNGEVTLALFQDRQAVVLIFYPATFTGICQGELAAVQEDLASLQNDDVQVIAVSVDSPFAHKVWAEQQGFTFPILADFWPHGAVAQAYGVFNDVVGRAIRGTFVIDRHGVVRWKVVNAIADARDHSDYAKVLAGL
jgi:mycoredoxin-dependent peroxiredoxin